MARKLSLPWAPGGSPTGLPGETEIEDRLRPVLIAGMVDADGTIQSYIPVGGSINSLPASESFQSLGSGSIGPGATREDGPIDMSNYRWLVIEVTADAALAAGMLSLSLLAGSTAGEPAIDVLLSGQSSGAPLTMSNSGQIQPNLPVYFLFEAPALPSIYCQLLNADIAAHSFSTRYRRGRQFAQ